MLKPSATLRIPARSRANGTNSFAIFATTISNLANSGTIQANGDTGRAIRALSGTVTNSVGGTIEANGLNGIAVQVATATVTNAGFVKATGAGGIGIDTTTGTLTNSGTISADQLRSAQPVVSPSPQIPV